VGGAWRGWCGWWAKGRRGMKMTVVRVVIGRWSEMRRRRRRGT
jgi:hypothetical protein